MFVNPMQPQYDEQRRIAVDAANATLPELDKLPLDEANTKWLATFWKTFNELVKP